MNKETLINIANSSWKELTEYKLQKFLYSIKARCKKFWNWQIWISKKEFEKFWINETRIYILIKTLLNNWIIKKTGERRNKKWLVCYVYEIAEDILKDFIDIIKNWTNKVFFKSDNISNRIIEWCKNTNIIDFIDTYWNSFWVKFEKRSQKRLEKGIYCKNNIITDFRNWISYNLFNYLRLKSWLEIYNLCKKVWIL